MNTRSTPAPAQQAVASATQAKAATPAYTAVAPSADSTLRVAFTLPQGRACPQCQHPWQANSNWCVECGAGVPCPHCGVACGGGDFCEGCGEWLLEGQCKLCYAALQDGAAFCQECGCNHQGTWCNRCQATSHFDFCTHCGDALSARAQELLAAAQQEAQQLQNEQALSVQNSPELLALIEEVQALEVLAQQEQASSLSDEDEDSSDGGWDDDDDYTPWDSGGGGSEPSAAPAAPAAPPRTKTISSGSLQKLRQAREAQEAAYQRAMEQARLQRIQMALQQSRGKRFPSAQEARLFHVNVQKDLHSNGARLKGWHCNYANYLHAHPNECHCPSDGGEWIVE